MTAGAINHSMTLRHAARDKKSNEEIGARTNLTDKAVQYESTEMHLSRVKGGKRIGKIIE